MEKHKLMSLEALYNFYTSKNKDVKFSAIDEYSSIIVSIPGKVKFEVDNMTEGLMPVVLEACHDGLNRNQSFINTDIMTNALPSLKNRPILGFIHDVNGQPEFYSHNIHEDENGNVVYDEIPVGVIPESCDAKLVFSDEYQKNFVVINGIIYEDYTQAADILRREQKCSVSVEISINDLSYDAKNKMMVINDFIFLGVTILGKDDNGNPIGEGMLGSNIVPADTTQDVNQTFNVKELQEKIDLLISCFNKNQSLMKGGNNKSMTIKELMEKYAVTEEQITFETDGLSDEDLEKLFKEKFENTDDTKIDTDVEPEIKAEDNADASAVIEEPTTDTIVTETETVVTEGCGGGSGGSEGTSKKKKYSITNSEGITKDFDISLNDTISALEDLVNMTYSESDNTYYCVTVYDGYLVMSDFWNGRFYRQSYVDSGNDTFNLTGDREEVYVNFLTSDEEAKLNNMTTTYEELKNYKETSETKILNESKDLVLNSEDYSKLKDVKEFQELKGSKENYSIEALTKEADAILGNFSKTHKVDVVFSAESKKKSNKIGFSVAKENTKRASYSGLFEKSK